MRTVLALIKKEFLQIFRNPLLWRLIVFIPFLMLMIFPYAADLDIKNLNIVVIDHDRSTFSQDLIAKLDGHGLFTRFGNIQNKREADNALERDKIDMIIEIPQAYERDVQKGIQPTISVTMNAINGMKAGVGVSYITNVLADFMSEIHVVYNEPVELPGRISMISNYWFNEKMNFRNIFVPGILTILVTMIGSLLSTLNIVREKEMGTIEQLNITPMKKHQFIFGKMIPFWLIGMFEFGVGLLIMRFFFGIHVQGSVILLLALTGIFLLGMLGLGFLVSIFSRTQVQSMFIIVFVFITFILLSGLFTSIDSMPEWAKIINTINPVAYFMGILKLVILKGGTLQNLQTEIISLSIFAVFINTLILFFYKREID
ncbi:MAG: ABC transporter permease [Bacteroidales bacterium]|jgi:ABC-2 type transport system permease protein|nr:ABC transporter permease [Bacteroidales bacterium]